MLVMAIKPIPQNQSKEKLLIEIDRLKKELKKRKKYGLVWEEKPEEVAEMCKQNLPILKEVKEKEIITNKEKPINLLIEGDNYHALSVLNYTHAKKIDVIYIDPPYNTGNKDFIFNDNYVDREDAYRHSKWLSFMEKRLKLAKNLLKETGVIFVSIDDNEIANLKLLMNNFDLFGEDNFVAQLIRVSSPSQNVTKFVSIMHDYCLIYCKNKTMNSGDWKVQKNYVAEFQKRAKQLLGSGVKNEEIEKELKELVKYPRFFDMDHYYYADSKGVYQTVSAGGVKKGNTKSVIYHPITKKACKIPEGGWRYKEEEIRELEKTDLWHFGNDENTIPRRKLYLNDYLFQKPKGVSFYDSQSDVAALKNLGIPFDFPKPTQFIKWLLQMNNQKNLTVLDFFAGSGTTAQAVLEMNKEDEGNRKFILCTDNQDNNGSGLKIAEDICYPRIKKVIEGFKNNFQLGGNLKYFKTGFVGAKPTDGNKTRLTAEATAMLCIKEGTFEKILDQKNFKIFKDTDHYTGIIYEQSAIPAFKKTIENIKAKFSVYIFSLTDETFDHEFKDIKQKVQVYPIPEVILRVYRRIFK